MSELRIAIMLDGFEKARRQLNNLRREMRRLRPMAKRFRLVLGYRIKTKKMVNRLKQL